VSRWSRAVAVACVVALSVGYVVLGADPSPPQLTPAVPDWLQHGAAYALLAALTAVSLHGLITSFGGLAALYASVHGAVLEVIQFFNPPRTAEWSDLLADVVGAAAGAAVVVLVARDRTRRARTR